MPIQRSIIPPAGPAWTGSLMGTSIISTLLKIHGVASAAVFFAVIATGILAVTLYGLVRYRTPRFIPEHMGPWGMFAMGVISLGSAWSVVTGDMTYQLIGYITGGLGGFVIAINQWRKFVGSPNFQWGLALVVPMVASTSAAQLGFINLGRFGFTLVWIIGVPVFVYVYFSLMRGRASIPVLLGNTAWIPVGVIGQSTAAAQLLFPHDFGLFYASVMLPLGVAASIYALFHEIRTVRAWAPYSPAWWGATFPVGTMSLGTHFVALNAQNHIFDVISQGFLALLIFNWVLCVARFLTWWFANLRERD
ncbi:MAG: tellurium resistance protein [Corynebacterium casei]|uniref:SLAC1 family transporter n=1 Tax=Corynebacterium casei TaxID=160386 RepID=UPI003F93F2F0